MNAGMEGDFHNKVNIKPNKTKPLANSEVDWIRNTTIWTRNIYRFGAAKKIVILADQRSHTIKKL